MSETVSAPRDQQRQKAGKDTERDEANARIDDAELNDGSGRVHGYNEEIDLVDDKELNGE
jgi:hypothetical protein